MCIKVGKWNKPNAAVLGGGNNLVILCNKENNQLGATIGSLLTFQKHKLPIVASSWLFSLLYILMMHSRSNIKLVIFLGQGMQDQRIRVWFPADRVLSIFLSAKYALGKAQPFCQKISSELLIISNKIA